LLNTDLPDTNKTDKKNVIVSTRYTLLLMALFIISDLIIL